MKNKEEEISVKQIVIVTLIVATIIGGIVLITQSEKSKTEKALDSYKEAVKLCGKDNTREHRYDNGTADFDCSDYSKAVEIIK